MTTIDFLEKIGIPLVAAFIGAAVAFLYLHKLEIRREKRHILQTLMAYRNVGAHELDWIKSLNIIDIVYHDNKKVRALLHKFFAYTEEPFFSQGQHLDVLYELIYAMAQCSGYKNLELSDIRDYYAPRGLNMHYTRLGKDVPKDDTSNPAQ